MYIIKKSEDGSFYFHIKAGNNAITRHDYDTRPGAIEGAKSEINIILDMLPIPKKTRERIDKILEGDTWYLDKVPGGHQQENI